MRPRRSLAANLALQLRMSVSLSNESSDESKAHCVIIGQSARNDTAWKPRFFSSYFLRKMLFLSSCMQTPKISHLYQDYK